MSAGDLSATLPERLREALTEWITDAPTRSERAERGNAVRQALHELTGFPHPVGAVRWVPIDRVVANDYNPNSVARHEMELLHTSIAEDGYTMPIVTIWNPDKAVYEIVDGFHRYTTMRMYGDIAETTCGYLPIVVIDKPVADRIASTVRHNRARGKHSVTGMSSLVFQMLKEGESDATICRKLGLEAEELARLKHITGFSKLFANRSYTEATMSAPQLRAKAEYKRTHPDEHVPTF